MRAVVVPAVPALLDRYRSLTDPVAELRERCREAVDWLLEGVGGVEVLGDEPLARRIGSQLLQDRPARGAGPGLLVLANGSACRGEKAPGHLDPRSFDHDEQVGAALASGDGARLTTLDERLGRELLTSGAGALRELGRRLPTARARILYEGDPFGVQYWVAAWEQAT